VVLYNMPPRSGGVGSGLEIIVPALLECDFFASPSHTSYSCFNTLIIVVLHRQAYDEHGQTHRLLQIGPFPKQVEAGVWCQQLSSPIISRSPSPAPAPDP
jgi:hypothetical protein